MKRRLALSILLTLPGVAHSETCPTTIEQWERWRLSILEQIRDADPKASNGHPQAQAILDKLAACPDPQLTCLAPVRELANRLYAVDRRLKNEVAEYNRQAALVHPDAVRLPAELIEDKEFNKLTSDGLFDSVMDTQKRGDTVRGIKKLVNKLNPNAQVLLYTSAHFAAPDFKKGDAGRMLIYYPKPEIDLWLQWGVPAQTYETPWPMNISLVSVVKKDRAGNELKPVQSFFQDYDRADPAQPYASAALRRNYLDCRNCHQNGPDPIWPYSKFTSLHDPTLAATLNDVMGGYGLVAMPGLAPTPTPAHPSLGAAVTRDLAHIPGCNPSQWSKLKPASRERVAQALSSCTSCHDGINRSPIDLYPEPGYLNSAVVSSRAMPPGAELDSDERLALRDCLLGETQTFGTADNEGALIRWARGIACDGRTLSSKSKPHAKKLTPQPPSQNLRRSRAPQLRSRP